MPCFQLLKLSSQVKRFNIWNLITNCVDFKTIVKPTALCLCDGKKGEQSFQLRMTRHVLKLAKHVQSSLPACAWERACATKIQPAEVTGLEGKENSIAAAGKWCHIHISGVVRPHTSPSLFLSVINVTQAHCSKYRSQPFSLGTTWAAATQCAVVSALQSLSVLSTFPIASSPTFTRRTERDLSIGSAAEKRLLLAVNKDTFQT